MGQTRNIYTVGKDGMPSTDNGINSTKRKKRMSAINVGQFLVLFSLIFVLAIQFINIYFSKNNIQIAENDGLQQSEIGSNENISDDIARLNSDSANSNGETLFLLGLTDENKIAILSPDRQVVYEIFDIFADTLPEYDQNLLNNGIKITDVDDLYALIEDYSS